MQFATRKTLQALFLLAGFALAVLLVRTAVAGAAENGSGRPGETAVVSVAGARPNRPIVADLAGTTFSTTSDRAGRARLEIVVPDVPAGAYRLRLQGAVAGELPFRVLESAPENPAAGAGPSQPAPVPEGPPDGAARAATLSDARAAAVGIALVLAGLVGLAVIGVVVRQRRRPAGPPELAPAPVGPPLVRPALLWAPRNGDLTIPW